MSECTCKKRLVQFDDGSSLSVPEHLVAAFEIMLAARFDASNDGPGMLEAALLTLSEVYASGWKHAHRDLVAQQTGLQVREDVH